MTNEDDAISLYFTLFNSVIDPIPTLGWKGEVLAKDFIAVSVYEIES